MRKQLLIAILVLMLGVQAFAGYAAEGGKKKVALLWYEKSGVAESVARGFFAQMREKYPQVELEAEINLTKDAMGKVYDNYQASFDGVVFLRSTGAQYMVKNPPKCPGFFGACNNPLELKVVKDLKAPGGNLTGVSYYVPIAKQFEVYKKLFPQLKNIALLVDKRNPASGPEIAEFQAACSANNITYIEAAVTSKDELVKVVSELSGKCDLFVAGNTGLILDNGGLIAALAPPTPFMSLAEKPIAQKQALGGLVADNEELGRNLADLVNAVVVEGKNPSETPVGLLEQPPFSVNLRIAKEQNIKIPEELLKNAKQLN